MITDILVLIALAGGLSFGLGVLSFLAWIATAELYSLWMHRTGRRVVTRYPDERDL